MKIYVASSWRNLLQPGIVHALRRCGHEVRVWKGRTAKGVEVTAYIAALQVDADADAAELERELLEVEHPSGVCRSCGCNDNDACPGGCAWTDDTHTLCTGCV